jgi:hypothetical protein
MNYCTTNSVDGQNVVITINRGNGSLVNTGEPLVITTGVLLLMIQITHLNSLTMPTPKLSDILKLKVLLHQWMATWFTGVREWANILKCLEVRLLFFIGRKGNVAYVDCIFKKKID